MSQAVSVTWTAASGAAGYLLKARLQGSATYTVSTDVGNVTTGVISVPSSGSWRITCVAYDGLDVEAAYSQELETEVRPLKLVLVGK